MSGRSLEECRCTVCYFQASRPWSLRRHMKNIHGLPEDDNNSKLVSKKEIKRENEDEDDVKEEEEEEDDKDEDDEDEEDQDEDDEDEDEKEEDEEDDDDDYDDDDDEMSDEEEEEEDGEDDENEDEENDDDETDDECTEDDDDADADDDDDHEEEQDMDESTEEKENIKYKVNLCRNEHCDCKENFDKNETEQPSFKEKWMLKMTRNCGRQLNELFRASPRKRKAILEKSKIGLVGLIKNYSTDILKGKIKITENHKKKLAPHAAIMRQLTSKYNKKKYNIELILKKNFLDILLSI